MQLATYFYLMLPPPFSHALRPGPELLDTVPFLWNMVLASEGREREREREFRGCSQKRLRRVEPVT